MSVRVVSCVVMAIVSGATSARGAELVLNRFNDASEVSKWRNDFGLPSTLTFDPAMDAGGGTSPGSMRVTRTFDAAAGGDNKSAITNDAFFPGRDVSGYRSLDADFFIDPASAASTGAGPDVHGYLGFAIRNTNNYNYQSEPGRNFTPSGGWFHVSVPISGFAQPVDAMRALTLQLYGGQNLSGPVTYWIDNVVFTPEPGTLGAAALGLALLALRRRTRPPLRPVAG